ELLVASVILVLVSTWAAHAWAQRVRDLQAQSLAVWMMTAQDAVAAYLGHHRRALAEAADSSALALEGFADWSKPSWAEMQAVGLLPAAWTQVGPMGHAAGVQVLRSGVCPGTACTAWALVHTSQPLLHHDGHSVDEGLIAQWLMAVQGRGMVVWPHASEMLSGAGRRLPSPEGWLAGTVALAVGMPTGGTGDTGASQPDLSQYLKVQDDRDPDFQGDTTVKGDVRSGASLWARDYLVLGQAQFEHDPCADEGALSLERGYDGSLLCRSGRWRSAGRAHGGAFLVNNRRGCYDAHGAFRGNPLTDTCACPFNYAAVMVSDTGTEAAPEGRTSGYICIAMR
ncbi:MAG TPA: hypothetical protein VL024_04970, partial [Castellaniella sp.]|nr:hypothetical protein [Castellaniella sp.]